MAWWLLNVGIAGIVLPFVMAVIRKLYFNDIFTDNTKSAMHAPVSMTKCIVGSGEVEELPLENYTRE